MLNTPKILERLAAADRVHQKEAGGKLLLGSVKYACAAVLSVFVLDVILHLNAGWRLGLLLAMIAGVCALAGFGWHLAFVRRNRLEHIARFLETRDPALGSRLINLLQLSAQTRDASLAPLTRELAGLAVKITPPNWAPRRWRRSRARRNWAASSNAPRGWRWVSQRCWRLRSGFRPPRSRASPIRLAIIPHIRSPVCRSSSRDRREPTCPMTRG